jgi:hypothetical protein
VFDETEVLLKAQVVDDEEQDLSDADYIPSYDDGEQ